MSKTPVTCLIDTSWVVYRSHHAYSDLCVVRDGQPVETGVLYGALVVCRSVRRRYPDARMFWCLDSERNLRKELHPWYKAGRVSSSGAWDRKAELLSLLGGLSGSYLLQADGYEGDDVIASAARQTPGTKVIFGSDKDLLQLLTEPDTTVVSNFSDKGFRSVNRDEFELTWSVKPERLLMLRSILGDSSDKIPRLIPRLREKVAVEVALAYETPQIAWENREDLAGWAKIELTPELYERWQQHYELMRLKTVPVVRLLPETRPAEYWEQEWGLRDVASLL